MRNFRTSSRIWSGAIAYAAATACTISASSRSPSTARQITAAGSTRTRGGSLESVQVEHDDPAVDPVDPGDLVAQAKPGAHRDLLRQGRTIRTARGRSRRPSPSRTHRASRR